eukprot:84096_1
MNYSRAAQRNFRKKQQNNYKKNEKKPLTVEEELLKQNKIKNRRERSATVHELLDGVFNKLALEVPFEERLTYRMLSGRPAVRLNFNGKIGGGEFYLDDPVTHDIKFSKVIPVWGKLKIYSRGQDHKPFTGGRVAEVTLAWEEDEYDSIESGIGTFEEFILGIRELFSSLNNVQLNQSNLFENVFGRYFNLKVDKREYDAPEMHKYIFSNAYVSSLYKKSGNDKDDITANYIRDTLKKKYPGYKITVSRFGSRKFGIPKSLLIKSSGEIDMEWLKRDLRHVSGQRGYWDVFVDKKKNNWQEKSQEVLLKELRETKMEKFKIIRPYILKIDFNDLDSGVIEYLDKEYKKDGSGNYLIEGKESIKYKRAELSGTILIEAAQFIYDVKKKVKDSLGVSVALSNDINVPSHNNDDNKDEEENDGDTDMLSINNWDNKDFQAIELSNEQGQKYKDNNYIWKGIVFSINHKQLVETVQRNIKDANNNDKKITTEAAVKLLYAAKW